MTMHHASSSWSYLIYPRSTLLCLLLSFAYATALPRSEGVSAPDHVRKDIEPRGTFTLTLEAIPTASSAGHELEGGPYREFTPDKEPPKGNGSSIIWNVSASPALNSSGVSTGERENCIPYGSSPGWYDEGHDTSQLQRADCEAVLAKFNHLVAAKRYDMNKQFGFVYRQNKPPPSEKSNPYFRTTLAFQQKSCILALFFPTSLDERRQEQLQLPEAKVLSGTTTFADINQAAQGLLHWCGVSGEGTAGWQEAKSYDPLAPFGITVAFAQAGSRLATSIGSSEQLVAYTP